MRLTLMSGIVLPVLSICAVHHAQLGQIGNRLAENRRVITQMADTGIAVGAQKSANLARLMVVVYVGAFGEALFANGASIFLGRDHRLVLVDGDAVQPP